MIHSNLLEINAKHRKYSSLVRLKLWVKRRKYDVNSLSPAQDHNYAAYSIDHEAWSSSAERVNHCLYDIKNFKMCHKLENPEGVEETANSQTD
jgi:hypothetical protein